MTIGSISPYLRGLAIIGVFVENYLSWIGVNAPGPGLAWFIRYVQFFGASLVHIFFVLSGYGLAAKYLGCSRFPWKAYAANRFAMIVVPYWMVVTASYLFINLLHGWDPGTFGAQFGPTDLLAYLLFMRNFIMSSWDLNPTLWFMQAIFGLYVLFPFLLALQKKHGLKSLLIVSVLLVCASRGIYVASGLPIDRESGFFLFYTLEFAIGMALAATPKFSRLLKTGVSARDPALHGSGECSHATAVTAGCLRREAGSERDGICCLEPPASGFKLMTALADGPALGLKQSVRSNGISKGSVSAWCLLVAFAGYAVSYLLKIKIGIPANLHDVFTCVGSFALGVFSYQVLSFLKLEKIERAIGSIGKLAFVIYLLHAPPIQHLIKPLLKRYYENSQGIFEVCAILIVYFAIVVLVSKPLARYLLSLSSKIEAYISKPT